MLKIPNDEKKGVSHERWLVSYADFITLLFATFTVLYAISAVDTDKFEKASKSVKQALGVLGVDKNGEEEVVEPPVTPPIEELEKTDGGRSLRLEEQQAKAMLNDLTGYIDVNRLQDDINVEVTPRGIVITLAEAGFFPSGSSTLKPSAYGVFAQLAMVLTRYEPELHVEGHTDDRPINSARHSSNWSLSTDRAVSIVEVLVDDFGYTAGRLAATGFGEHKPVATNETTDGRARNRRVELVVVGTAGMAGAEDEQAPSVWRTLGVRSNAKASP